MVSIEKLSCDIQQHAQYIAHLWRTMLSSGLLKHNRLQLLIILFMTISCLMFSSGAMCSAAATDHPSSAHMNSANTNVVSNLMVNINHGDDNTLTTTTPTIIALFDNRAKMICEHSMIGPKTKNNDDDNRDHMLKNEDQCQFDQSKPAITIASVTDGSEQTKPQLTREIVRKSLHNLSATLATATTTQFIIRLVQHDDIDTVSLSRPYETKADIYVHLSRERNMNNDDREQLESLIEKEHHQGRNSLGSIHICPASFSHINSAQVLKIGSSESCSQRTDILAVIDATDDVEAAIVGSTLVATLLQVNPELTARDIRYILIHSTSLEDSSSTETGNILWNECHGFGKINMKHALELAQSWRSSHNPLISNKQTKVKSIRNNHDNTVSFQMHQSIYIEQIRISLNSSDAVVTLSVHAPSNKEFEITTTNNQARTLQFWGEQAKGDWRISLKRVSTLDIEDAPLSITLELLGTKDQEIIIIPDPSPSRSDGDDQPPTRKPWWKIGKLSLNSIIIAGIVCLISLTIGTTILAQVIRMQMEEYVGEDDEVEDEIWNEMVQDVDQPNNSGDEDDDDVDVDEDDSVRT